MIHALAAALACATASPDMAYTFELRTGPSVGITLRTTADADGTTEICVEEQWGGITGHAADIIEVTATGADGLPLDLAREAEHRWVLTSAPGAPVQITYTLVQPERAPLRPGHNDYRTRIEPGLFMMIGNLGLLYPAHLEGPSPRTIEFEWRGFDAPGTRIVSSFGPGGGPLAVTLPPGRARSSLFMAGRFELHERDLNGTRLGVAIVPDDWGFEPGRFMELAAAVVTSQREFFDDFTDPWYLVALTPSGRAAPNSLSLGGTGLLNCFALYCNAGLDLSPGSTHLVRIVQLLSHEHFHTWNGVKFRIDAPEGAAYWFSEGFTDFYGRRLARAAGLLTDEQFAEELNASLARYDRSPVKNVPNQRIVADFWTDRDVSQLPYSRGDLLALAVDEQIRAASGGKRSLDDLMRDLARRAAAGEPHPDMDGLLGLIERRTSPEFTAAVRQAALDGADVPLPPRITDPPLALSEGSVRFADPGLDVERSMAVGRVIGVREGTGAHGAGLRDGQTLRSLVFEASDSGPSEGVAEIEEGGTSRLVRFEAVGPPVAVRRYVRPVP